MQASCIGNSGLGLIATLLLAGCSAADNSAADSAALPAFADIEALTQKSCMCKMAGRDATAVARKLEKLTAPLQKEGFGSASLPLSSDVYCYPQLGDQACAGEYYVVATGTQDFVCTDAQMEELNALWNTVGIDADRRTTRADAALLKRLSTMRQELAETIPQSACNYAPPPPCIAAKSLLGAPRLRCGGYSRISA